MKIAVICDVEPVIWYKFTDVSEVLTASIIRKMSKPCAEIRRGWEDGTGMDLRDIGLGSVD
jgi:hypothetical protein